MSSGDASGTALVTGAGSGMGAAVARRLGNDGFQVVCADIDADAAGRTASEIPGARHAHINVTEQSSVRAAVDGCGPDLRAVVNAAGIATFAPVLDISLDDFDRVITVNLRGTFIVLQEAGRALSAEGGSIVTFASIESFRPVRGHAHYSASKGGVLMLTRAFAEELAPQGVRINAVAPGAIRTAMTAKALDHPKIAEAMNAGIPMGRAGEADEVANVCAFLCSPSTSYVTGACWAVDGGTLVKPPM